MRSLKTLLSLGVLGLVALVVAACQPEMAEPVVEEELDLPTFETLDEAEEAVEGEDPLTPELEIVEEEVELEADEDEVVVE